MSPRRGNDLSPSRRLIGNRMFNVYYDILLRMFISVLRTFYVNTNVYLVNEGRTVARQTIHFDDLSLVNAIPGHTVNLLVDSSNFPGTGSPLKPNKESWERVDKVFLGASSIKRYADFVVK